MQPTLPLVNANIVCLYQFFAILQALSNFFPKIMGLSENKG